MAREGASTAILNASKDAVVRRVVFVELYLDSGTLYVNSDVRTLTWNGHNYVGVGDCGGIQSIEEEATLKPSSIVMSLSGIAPEYLSEALGQVYQGRTVKVYEGFLDVNYNIIVDPVLAFEAVIEKMDFVDGKACTILLTAVNELYKWEKPNVARYTDADQQKRFTGDLGLAFVNEMTDAVIIWGQK